MRHYPCSFIIVLFLFSILSPPLYAQDKLPTTSSDGLKGPVRSAETRHLQGVEENGTRVERFLEHWRTEYDREGRVITEEIEGERNRRTKMDWSEKNPVAIIEEAGGRMLRREYIIGFGGNVAEVVTRGSDGSIQEKIIIDRDARGNQTWLRLYDSTGEVIMSIQRTYDSAGREMTSETTGQFHRAERYEYDSAGRRTVAYSCPHGLNTCERRTTYIYDSAGRIIEERQWNRNGRDTTWTPGNTITKAYDAHGTLILSELSDTARTYGNAKHELEYDSHGNWTKYISYQLVRSDGRKEWRPEWIRHRKITYY